MTKILNLRYEWNSFHRVMHLLAFVQHIQIFSGRAEGFKTVVYSRVVLFHFRNTSHEVTQYKFMTKLMCVFNSTCFSKNKNPKFSGYCCPADLLTFPSRNLLSFLKSSHEKRDGISTRF